MGSSIQECYTEKQQEVLERKSRYDVGLDKLLKTAEQVHGYVYTLPLLCLRISVSKHAAPSALYISLSPTSRPRSTPT